MQRAIELPFYEYMLKLVRNQPGVAEFLDTHRRVATAKQKLWNKHASFVLDACRMSGETCTSLGNGITNLVLAHYVAWKTGAQVLDGVVEGDDGLFVLRGKPPTKEQFADHGCIVKLEPVHDLALAGFCSMYVVEVDGKPVLIRDFREKLVKFGWTTTRSAVYSANARKGLLAAAGFSLAAEAGSCPVLWKVAECVLRDTVGATPDYQHEYKATAVQGFEDDIRQRVHSPSRAVREAYERMFNIDVSEQLRIEQEIETCGLTGPHIAMHCWTNDRAKMVHLRRDRRRGEPITYALDREC
jgi:hypothetical protein